METDDMLRWLAERPDIGSVRAAVCDLNGAFRGKRLPVGRAAKVFKGELRMPLSVSCPDIWGADVEDNPMVFEQGDTDGIAVPTGRGILAVDWLANPSAFIPLWMQRENGTPHPVDPRHALAAIVARYRGRSLTPVVAVELEFHLVDPAGALPGPPVSPVTGLPLDGSETLGLDPVDDMEAVIGDIFAACDAADIPLDGAISENGGGQFEINLRHVADPLKAADDAILFKRIVKGIARKHGFAGSFMAKPYPGSSGSGLHVHFSLLDADGRNVFDDGGPQGSEMLGQATAGLIGSMRDAALVFAPHLNSYRRWQPGSHAPHTICWGYESRHVALRVPGGAPAARRIEHRVAGADANPYLVLAAVLGAALDGIEAGAAPPPPVVSAAEAAHAEALPALWPQAIGLFEASAAMRRVFPAALVDAFTGMKRQELRRFAEHIDPFEIRTYLEKV